jgi:endogenous inhibitor of DNA gyrase (YacG/DUF329 family)
MSVYNTSLTVSCPTCKKTVAWTTEQTFKPFCSERCKLIDLGEWAMEEKRIAGEPLRQEEENTTDFFQGCD